MFVRHKMPKMRVKRHFIAVSTSCTVLLLAALAGVSPRLLADEPYAPSRDYDLQDIRTHLWLDADQRAVRGEVTEHVATLRDNVADLRFDSVDLRITSVTLDGKTAQFSTTPNELIVSLFH